jgi:pyruvate/2-oxoglutarate dehydrogenase complex dihydrolipoamide dehydrogenase (E3) component
MIEEFDSIIIGSGQAAPSLAVGLARRGETVALVEGDQLGGTCVNTGCTPTKTLRKSARVAHLARRAADFGVQTGPVQVDFAAAMARMRARSGTAREGLAGWLADTAGVSVVRGWGQFDGRAKDGRFRVVVGERVLVARQVYLNTGTRPFLPDVPGMADITPLDNASLLALTQRPDHLIVVGGSYIGLELGQIFRRLLSGVTILHRADRLAEREDPDVSEIIADFLRDEGVDLRLNTAIASVGKSMRGVLVTLADGTEIVGSHILFATGRVPNTDRLNLASVGLTADARGYIATDPRLKTDVPGIWALGDINRRGAFTHTSYHDHEIVLAERDGLTDLYQWQGADRRPTTYAMFTDPPLGRVGLSRTEAQALVAQGQRILIADVPMERVSRAKEESETTGLIRLIVDAETETFLGATVLGLAGDEVIATLSNFMATGSSYRILQQALPVHPTVAEYLPTVLAGLKPLEAADG